MPIFLRLAVPGLSALDALRIARTLKEQTDGGAESLGTSLVFGAVSRLAPPYIANEWRWMEIVDDLERCETFVSTKSKMGRCQCSQMTFNCLLEPMVARTGDSHFFETVAT